MSFFIRRATANDTGFVLALHDKPHVAREMHAPTAEGFRRALDRPGWETYIVELDGEPFAFLVMEIEGDWLVTARALAVVEPRRGAGRFAMEYAIARAFEELGVHRMFLEVLERNGAARALYERLGFRAEGLYRDGYRDESGAFLNLVPYGMLASDRRSGLAARS